MLCAAINLVVRKSQRHLVCYCLMRSSSFASSDDETPLSKQAALTSKGERERESPFAQSIRSIIQLRNDNREAIGHCINICSSFELNPFIAAFQSACQARLIVQPITNPTMLANAPRDRRVAAGGM
jgi:hypothetical protein